MEIEFGAGMLLLFVIFTSMWVGFDARSIGVEKGQLKGVCNMGPVGWFFACLGMWIISFPVYLAVRPKYLRINGHATANTYSNAASRKCPFCAELIKAEAKICRYCDRELPAIPVPSQPSVMSPQIEEEVTGPNGIGAFGVIVLILTFFALIFGMFILFQGTGRTDSVRTFHGTKTKAELGASLRSYEYKLVSVSSFKAAFGEPSQTQRMENTEYWYYNCSDGMLQVEMISPDITGGQISVKAVNGY